MSDPTTLEARIQRLEDIHVFTPDARWQADAMDADVTGIDNIVALLKTATAPGDLAMHSFTNPIIEIDGDTATANWLLWVAGTDGENGTEVFQSEDLTCVRTPQGWRIKSLNLHFGALRNI